jgi:peptidylprolyl isomerase
MKHRVLILLLVTSTVIAAQTTPKPSSTTGKTASAATAGQKLPPGVPVVRGIVKTAFSLRYEDFKIGTGKDAEPNKLYKVTYTGYRAADGVKFDSSLDHRRPVLDKDGKPVSGPDGKLQLGDPEPMSFPQGMGRLIPGFDQGFAGMKVGGKRRLFIPWQLAYGTREIPARGNDHPGIPAKSDLIFDVELVDVSDLPAMPQRPGVTGRVITPGAHPGAPGAPPTPPTPGSAPNPGSAPAPSVAPAAPGASPAPNAPQAPPPSQPANPPQPQSH